ncbi:unnamed protein product [Phytophthora fragariaefolia]|uniref:Unnamed protein product n=1 Tax=Phytophthora fragariaefolia TaxID=1490495 RepID=A0A9W6YF00_9STRA|nr:unnamed protein product [Phytophthora fragariaefolia]
MDTGATAGMISLDLARRLKLKLRCGYRLRVTGVGDVPTYESHQTRIKLTLGVRVVYVMDAWVGNFGGNVECLLGTDFMVAAGVRLCAREGEVRHPDEESVLMAGGREIDHVGLGISVRIPEATYLQPGRSVVAPVKYAQADPEKVDEWAWHGNHWVSQFFCMFGGEMSPPSRRRICETQVPEVPGMGKIVYEVEPSLEFLRHEEEVARLEELNGPPAVKRPNYQWPEKLLLMKNSSTRNQPNRIRETESSVMPPLPTGDNSSVKDEPRLSEMSEDRNKSPSDREPIHLVPENEDSEPEVVSRSVMGGGELTRRAQEELGRIFPD